MTITSITVACSSTIASSSPVVVPGGGAAVPAGGGIPGGGAGFGLAIESKRRQGGPFLYGPPVGSTNKWRMWREKSRFNPYPRLSVCILRTCVCGKDVHDGSGM